jgi:hypothetical protein
MDALSSFDSALVCFLNGILLKKIEKHTASITGSKSRLRSNYKRLLKFSELKDGKLLWTAFKWLINTSLRNVNLDVALDIGENHIRNNTPRSHHQNSNVFFQQNKMENYCNDQNDENSCNNRGMISAYAPSSLNTMLNSIKETFISPSSWNSIRNEIIDIYYEFPSVIQDYDNGNIDFKIRLVLELMVSIAVHSDNNEYYIKKIMRLRQDMQHMLMIAIQRQYVPSILESQTLSPVKLISSPRNKNGDNTEELTQEPEDFVTMENMQANKNQNPNNKNCLGVNVFENKSIITKREPEESENQKFSMDEKKNENEVNNTQFKNVGSNENVDTMTPQKFFKTPFGKKKRREEKRNGSNLRRRKIDEKYNNVLTEKSSPSLMTSKLAKTPSNMSQKISTQKKKIEQLNKQLKDAKEAISTLTRQHNNRHAVQEEMAIIIEEQNEEITKLKEKSRLADELTVKNAKLSQQLEDLENSDILYKNALKTVEKSNLTLSRVTKENKILRDKLLEQKDIEIDRHELSKVLNEKKIFEENQEYYKSQFEAKKIRCDQLEWQLAEEKQFLLNERTNRQKEIYEYEEKQKIAKENIKVLERSVDQLQFELQNEKDGILFKLENIRKEHKASILSYELAFHQKLAEVCRQRDEYAEVVDTLRGELKKKNKSFDDKNDENNN